MKHIITQSITIEYKKDAFKQFYMTHFKIQHSLISNKRSFIEVTVKVLEFCNNRRFHIVHKLKTLQDNLA